MLNESDTDPRTSVHLNRFEQKAGQDNMKQIRTLQRSFNPNTHTEHQVIIVPKQEFPTKNNQYY